MWVFRTRLGSLPGYHLLPESRGRVCTGESELEGIGAYVTFVLCFLSLLGFTTL